MGKVWGIYEESLGVRVEKSDCLTYWEMPCHKTNSAR